MNNLKSICRAAVFAVAAVFSIGSVCAQTAAPKADDLLRQVRMGLTASDDNDLKGYMSKQRGGKVNFVMSMRGDLISIQYLVNNNWERFDLHFKADSLDIKVKQGNSMVRLADSAYANNIADTDISYEDLSMRFLYWKNGKVDPKPAVVKGRNCWVVELKNPKPSVGNYAWVRAWIGIDDGALWRVHGYNKNGDLIKNFLLDSISKQKDGSWMFQKIKIEVTDPAKNKVVSYSTITRSN